jgi:hypothetical protein
LLQAELDDFSFSKKREVAGRLSEPLPVEIPLNGVDFPVGKTGVAVIPSNLVGGFL